MQYCSKLLLATFFVFSFVSLASSESYLGLNFGLSTSKSILGLSYTSGQNEINTGLKGFAFSSSGEYILKPGITYNRYFTESGWYGSLSYAHQYSNIEVASEKGWEPGDFFLGLGKNFQFTSWGVNLDGGILTPADGNFAKTADLWLGVGGSYRFKLD